MLKLQPRHLALCVLLALAAGPGCKSTSKEEGVQPQASSPAAPLYNRLGGEKTIRMVVDDFVNRAAVDPKVNFARTGTGREWQPTSQNVEKLKVHLTQFIMEKTGGPREYKGKDMAAVHRGMKIGNAEFDAAAADLAASLDRLRVPAREAQELMQIVASTRGDIVEQ
jgi:hemoglobin